MDDKSKPGKLRCELQQLKDLERMESCPSDSPEGWWPKPCLSVSVIHSSAT